MGIGILVSAEVPQRGLLRKRPDWGTLQKEITEQMPKTLGILPTKVTTVPERHEIMFQLHPAGEPLRFTWDPAGAVRAEVKTSTVGPGFHIFVVELLDRVADEIGLRWKWGGEEDQEGDESGYAIHRDAGNLQREMASFLRSLTKSMSEDEGDKHNIMLNLSLGYPVLDSECIMTPMGFISGDWLKETAQAEGDVLYEKCQEFFPWWQREQEAMFWRNAGLVVAWADMPWHKPNEDEKPLYQFVLDCFGRAKEMEEGIELPKAEIEEIHALMEGDWSAVPRPDGIGYHRQMMRHGLTGGWTIRLPGYYYQSFEENGTCVFWFGKKTVRFSSFSVRQDGGQPHAMEELVADSEKEASTKFAGKEIICLKTENLVGFATQRESEENGKSYHVLNCRILSPIADGRTLGICTICFDELDDRSWAIETFKTLAHHKTKALQTGES